MVVCGRVHKLTSVKRTFWRADKVDQERKSKIAFSTPAMNPKDIKEWIEYAKHNDVESMRSKLAEQPSLLNAAQSGIGNSALHWAAARSSQQVVQFLLDKRADASIRNASGSTPLHSAVCLNRDI